MRSAFLTHEPFYPPSGGGSAEAVYLVGELVRRGHSVHVFCPDFPDSGAAMARFQCQFQLFTGWPMGRYARWRNLKYLLYPGRLEQMVLKSSLENASPASFQFDLILGQHTISAVAAGRLRSRLQTPVILNYLDYLTGFMETWPAWVAPPPLVRALTRFELSLPSRYRVDGVLAVSSPLADRLAASGYPRDRILPILYGYDAGWFRPSSDPIPDGPPVVVMHGSFDRHHLGTIAEKAVVEIARRRPEVAFRFVGRMTDGLRAFTERIEKQCPSLRLQLPGFGPYESVADQLKNADVGLIPYEESNGTHCAFVAKAVEYLGCGLPVASTPLMNLTRYFAEEPAMAFGGFDGQSLAGVVLGWLDRSRIERRELGVRASARVATELDWSVITRRAVDFMEATVARSGLHRP